MKRYFYITQAAQYRPHKARIVPLPRFVVLHVYDGFLVRNPFGGFDIRTTTAQWPVLSYDQLKSCHTLHYPAGPPLVKLIYLLV